MKPKSKSLLPEYELGKVAPQAVDVEEAVLGTLMLGEAIPKKYMYQIQAEMFYKKDHKIIFLAMLRLYKKDDPIDEVSVTQELKRMGRLEEIGGAHKISLMSTNKRINDARMDYDIKILFQKSLQRKIIFLSYEWAKKAYEDTEDIFELLEDIEKEVKSIWSPVESLRTKKAVDVTDLALSVVDNDPGLLSQYYPLKEKKFDDIIGFSKSKIWILGGTAGDGKTRYVCNRVGKLMELYPDEIGILWYVLEDSSLEMLLNWLSSKVFIPSKKIQRREFPPEKKEEILKYSKEFSQFDIEFEEISARIPDIGKRFEAFCNKRPKKFNILIIDNLMSLGDQTDFKDKTNDFYDYVCFEMLQIRQRTKGFIIAVHHLKKVDEIDPSAVARGFRPTESDLKGTEGFRRVANYITLLNNPSRRTQLMAEYSKENQEILKNLLIVEGTKVRDTNTDSKSNIIHYLKTLDYCTFEEI